MAHKKIFISVFITIFICGCAPKQQIVKEKEQEQNETLLISIDENVTLPDSYKYYGPGLAIGALIGGVIGALFAESVSDGSSILEAYLDKYSINLAEMYFNEFSAAMIDTRKIELTQDENFDARINLEVKEFGFDKGWGFSNVKPLIKVNAKMVNKMNETLWEKSESISGWTSSTAARPFDKWLEDVERFKNDINYAFSYISGLQAESY
jgi:hypothetical protein